MPSLPVRILDCDGSVTRQADLIRRFDPAVVDLREWGPRGRIWCTGRQAAEVRTRLGPGLARSLTFTGSGDFHHLTAILLQQFTEPVSLIVFDHHPDCWWLPLSYGCGSWVRHALRRAPVASAVILGPSSRDLSCPWIEVTDFGLLAGDRVRIYPYAHPPAKVFLSRVPDNSSVTVRRGFVCDEIRWQELNQKDRVEFFLHLVRNLPVKRAYVSIDKDCLKQQDALTNWEEGSFDLGELLTFLNLIRENMEIVGADVTGEYSTPRIAGPVKRAIAAFDRPRDYSAKDKEASLIDGVNGRTNIRIAELITGSTA